MQPMKQWRHSLPGPVYMLDRVKAGWSITVLEVENKESDFILNLKESFSFFWKSFKRGYEAETTHITLMRPCFFRIRSTSKNLLILPWPVFLIPRIKFCNCHKALISLHQKMIYMGKTIEFNWIFKIKIYIFLSVCGSEVYHRRHSLIDEVFDVSKKCRGK